MKKKGVVSVTPTKGVGCVVATKGDYYMISLEVVSKPRLLAIWFGIVAALRSFGDFGITSYNGSL